VAILVIVAGLVCIRIDEPSAIAHEGRRTVTQLGSPCNAVD